MLVGSPPQGFTGWIEVLPGAVSSPGGLARAAPSGCYWQNWHQDEGPHFLASCQLGARSGPCREAPLHTLQAQIFFFRGSRPFEGCPTLGQAHPG